jgi:hypothetical protein
MEAVHVFYGVPGPYCPLWIWILESTKYIYTWRTHSVCPLVRFGTPRPLSRQRVCTSPPPLEPKEGGTIFPEHTCHGGSGWGRGSTNSDDWRKSLALCLLCASEELRSETHGTHALRKVRKIRQHFTVPAVNCYEQYPKRFSPHCLYSHGSRHFFLRIAKKVFPTLSVFSRHFFLRIAKKVFPTLSQVSVFFSCGLSDKQSPQVPLRIRIRNLKDRIQSTETKKK